MDNVGHDQSIIIFSLSYIIDNYKIVIYFNIQEIKKKIEVNNVQ